MDDAAEDSDLRSVIRRATSALVVCDNELLEKLAAYCGTPADDVRSLSDNEWRSSEHTGAGELQVFGRLLGSTEEMLTIFRLLELNRRGQLEYSAGSRSGT